MHVNVSLFLFDKKNNCLLFFDIMNLKKLFSIKKSDTNAVNKSHVGLLIESSPVTTNPNNTSTITTSSSGGRFLAIRNWLKQNRLRSKKDKSQSTTTSPLLITQELQKVQDNQSLSANQSPLKPPDQNSSPLQFTNLFDKKSSKKSAKIAKNKFKKLNSDYNLNNQDNSNTTLTSVNPIQTNPSTSTSNNVETMTTTTTPLKNLTNNNKIAQNSPGTPNIGITNTPLNKTTPVNVNSAPFPTQNKINNSPLATLTKISSKKFK